MRSHVPNRVYRTAGAQWATADSSPTHLTILRSTFDHDLLFFIEISSMKLRDSLCDNIVTDAHCPSRGQGAMKLFRWDFRISSSEHFATYGAEHMLLQPQRRLMSGAMIPYPSTQVLTPDEFGTSECHDADFRRPRHNHLTSKRLLMAITQSTSIVRSYSLSDCCLLQVVVCQA